MSCDVPPATFRTDSTHGELSGQRSDIASGTFDQWQETAVLVTYPSLTVYQFSLIGGGQLAPVRSCTGLGTPFHRGLGLHFKVRLPNASERITTTSPAQPPIPSLNAQNDSAPLSPPSIPLPTFAPPLRLLCASFAPREPLRLLSARGAKLKPASRCAGAGCRWPPSRRCCWRGFWRA
jgi:hypothetical protein